MSFILRNCATGKIYKDLQSEREAMDIVMEHSITSWEVYALHSWSH